MNLYTGYLPFPRIIMKSIHKFKRSEIAVITYLLGRVPNIYPKVNTISRELGISRATVFRALKFLEENNMIKRHRFYNQSNVYEIQPALLRPSDRAKHSKSVCALTIEWARRARELGKKFYNAREVSLAIYKNKNESIKTGRIEFLNQKRVQKPNQGFMHIASILNC